MPDSTLSDSSRRGSLLVIFLTVFIDLLGFAIVLPLLPIYADDLAQQYDSLKDHTGFVIGPLMASFSAMQFLFAPLWGRLSDRIGRRPVLMVGLAGSVVFYTLFGLATSWGSIVLLFVARIGAGISGATISTAQAYIADTTTLETRAKGMALIGAAFGLGFALGPLFGFLALLNGPHELGPGPGFAAAGLSAVALLLAVFKLPESLRPDSDRSERKLFDLQALRTALSIPSMAALFVSMFVCIFAFGNFETTLSMLVEKHDGAFRFDLGQVCLMFAYIGFTLTIAQGFLVRRLSGRVPEGTMATTGSVIQVLGFLLMVAAIGQGSAGLLFTALTIVVCGYAFMMPSLNSLISRRSDPTKQGGILGVAQSVSAMARILGPMVALPVLQWHTTLPYWMAAALMLFGMLLVIWAARSGRDFASPFR